MPGRRRIDRILSEDYLADLDERDTDEIRRMRADCQQEETGISYTRRVLQGRIDILRAEIERRGEAGDERAESVLAGLPEILGDEDHTSEPTEARVPQHLQPPVMEDGRREIDRVVDEAPLGSLETRGTDELGGMAEELIERERALSETRQVLFDRIDRLEDELVRRYRDGAADPADALAE